MFKFGDKVKVKKKDDFHNDVTGYVLNGAHNGYSLYFEVGFFPPGVGVLNITKTYIENELELINENDS